MQYEVSKLGKNNLSLNKSQVFSVIGLYCFVLGTSLLGFSIYLFLESSGFVEQAFINWSGQGLFWSFITLFISLFVLFIPVEFFSEYFIENRSFKNLLTNVVSVIFISLFFLVVFQVLLRNQNVFLTEYLVITRAVSFSGFISIPLYPGYWEYTETGKYWRGPLSIKFANANTFHRVDLNHLM